MRSTAVKSCALDGRGAHLPVGAQLIRLVLLFQGFLQYGKPGSIFLERGTGFEVHVILQGKYEKLEVVDVHMDGSGL